jgi:rhomboid protease GluP
MSTDEPVYIPIAPPGVRTGPPPRLPIVTLVLLVLNVLVFVLMTLAGGSTSPEVLLDFGAASKALFRQGEYWRLVMPMFLHIGFWHLAVNSYALWALGRMLERVYGYGRFALLYVVSGIGCSYLSMVRSDHISAGASGAIFGIAGAMLVTGYLHRQVVPRRWGRVFGQGMLPVILLNLVLGSVIPMIDNWGHLGGLVTGVLLALLIPPPGHEVESGAVAEEPSQAMVLVPVILVALSLAGAAGHYRTTRVVTHLLQQGERLHSAHQNDQARAAFQEAARRAPRDERPHLALGSLDLEQHRTGEAMEEFKQALRFDPDSPRARLGLGSAYQQKGDLAKAQQQYEAVLGKNPQDADQQEIFAELCMEQKLYPQAIDHFQQALRLKPDMAVSHNNLAWLYATSEDPQYRNPAQALEHARRAVELSNWKEPIYIDTLAEAFYVSGNPQEAVRVEARALELDSKTEYQDHMARYRKAAGD